MQITSQSVIKDYQALRAAANNRSETLEISAMTGRDLDIVSASIDENPVTQDRIMASAWNGDFSSSAARLTFTETQVAGKQVLEFNAKQPKGFASAEVENSTALLDLQSGMLISASGSGNFLVAEVSAPAPVTPPKAPNREELAIRATYDELKTLVAENKVGAEFFVESIGHQVTLDTAADGVIGVSYWGGAFSGPGSGTLTETYREFKEDGAVKLHFTKIDPGDFQGNDASQINRTLAL